MIDLVHYIKHGKKRQFKILVASKTGGQIIFSKLRNLDEWWVLDFLNILIS